MSSQTVTLDVREEIRRGAEPFTRIMNTVARLLPEENMLLIAPFEPKPLFSVLGKQGFGHTSYQNQLGDWEVLFTRNHQKPDADEPSVPSQPKARSTETSPTGRIITVDARGLEPPQPLVKILETLASLPIGAELHACTDRRPMHLYAQLEARGFAGESEEQSDGSFITKIRSR